METLTLDEKWIKACQFSLNSLSIKFRLCKVLVMVVGDTE